jgi:ABC-2 type transport system permease protein
VTDDRRPDGGRVDAVDGRRRARSGAGTDGRPRPAGYRHLIRAVLHREYLLFVRYPADAVGGVVVSLLFFGLLFYGGRAIAGRALTDSIEGIVVGYFLWTLSVGAYSAVANDIGSEVQWGTLERHFVTPFGFAPVALAKGAAKVVRSLVLSSVILAAMLVVTGTRLQVPVVTVVVVAGLAITSVLGVGFAAGGLSVLYKRIGSWLGLLQFAFPVLVAAPAFELGWTRYLPLAQGSALLQRAMLDGTRLWEFAPVDLAVLVGVAAAYVAGGYAVFHYATRRARRLGVLGDY